MERNNLLSTTLIAATFSLLLFSSCGPLREFGKTASYSGTVNYDYPLPVYDSMKKTVIIVANNDGTELFDMMAPFYLFNATGKVNVYIVAKQKHPVVVKKGLFVLPQSTFSEIDSLHIKADVIVIPYLAAADSAQQDPVIVNWIREHYSLDVTVLSVCDGSATAAATGIYDGKPMTAHASDYAGIKSHFNKPLWVQNTTVAGSGNLYSTAGVSNATEGSLVVIHKLFGEETMRMVIDEINYPYLIPKMEHQSKSFERSDKAAAGKKIFFKKNRKVGVLLRDGINEFEVAAIMDTYNRTFPKSIASYSINDSVVVSKFGLTLIPTGKTDHLKLDELHVISPVTVAETKHTKLKYKTLVQYNAEHKQYIIDECLGRIRSAYGDKFENVVKLMLDYN